MDKINLVKKSVTVHLWLYNLSNHVGQGKPLKFSWGSHCGGRQVIPQKKLYPESSLV